MKVLKCNRCGKMVVQLNDKPCPTFCCGEAMSELTANTTDAAVEKHVPYVTREGDLVKVQIGEVIHPMLEAHYIEWIALVTKNNVFYKELKPGDEPVAEFKLVEGDEVVAAYDYCTLHGFWKA